MTYRPCARRPRMRTAPRRFFALRPVYTPGWQHAVPSGREEGAVVRALIVSEFVTLDGVMEAGAGTASFGSRDGAYRSHRRERITTTRSPDAVVSSAISSSSTAW